MGWFGGRVVPRNKPFCDLRRCQFILDRKVREWKDNGTPIIDDSYQASAGGQHRLSWILWAAVRLIYRTFSILKFEREKLRQLFDMEWTESDHKALKETVRVHIIFLVDVQ